jgi:DeoR family fructose operon transcriptional repressor
MLAEERKNRIVEITNKNKSMKVADLSLMFNTTEATIRRDLEELQSLKKIRRVHGGAISVAPSSKLLYTEELSVLCTKEKEMIAKAAYAYVDDNDAIILDASTTVRELAKLIAEGNRKNLSIVTNSFDAVSILSKKKDINVLHTGGQVKYHMNYSVGLVTEKTLANLRVDKCFLGTNGIDIEYGYSVPTLDDAAIKEAMLKCSKQHFVLADHTKFEETYMGKFSDFHTSIDYIITDSYLPYFEQEGFKTSVELVIAEQE